MHDNQIQSVLNPTIVGSSFFSEAQIKAMLVSKAMKYNHHICSPNISAGMMIMALATQLTASMML